MANDDPILTTMRFIPQHEVIQKYGANLPDYLITPAMKESEAFKTYYAFATGKATPKPNSDDDDDNEGDDDATNDDHDDADNQSERTESDNEGDEFVHPKFITHDEEEKEEESSDPRVHTPSQSEPSDNEANVDVAQSEYTKEEEVNVEHTYEEEDANNLYNDLNANLEGRDADMTDAPQITQVIEDTYVTLTLVNPEGQQQSSLVSSGFISNMLNPNPDTGIDSILNTESTSLVEIPFTYVLPNFGSLFGFDNRLKTLEQGFYEFIQTNQYATVLSSIPNIIDNYLGSKLKEAVDVAIQLKSDIIREEAQAENEDFLNKLDDNINKIIKDQVKEQVKA
ncbi:hypothetical protein Tco_0561750 [Tanacetum coccineum]